MNLNCGIAEDLLPLYLEDGCSQDSRAALEEHLKGCPACRDKLARMQSPGVASQPEKDTSQVRLAHYAKKVRRRRLRLVISAALGTVLAACMLSICFLAVRDMRAQADPVIHEVEQGVWNLTAGDLKTTAAEVGTYVLYTNYEQIQVSVSETFPLPDSLLLWDTTDRQDQDIVQYGMVDPDTGICVFEGLTASRRYRITCEGGENAALTVSEGRQVSFLSSLGRVVQELFSAALG